MLASQVLAPARILGKDPPPGTYSDAALLTLLDLVCKDVITKVKFPFARISTPTVAGQQAYQLPETPIDDGLGCVWLNGQLLTKTDIATLQGQQIGYYDQSGFGTQAAGSDGPTANAGSYAPQWTVQPPGSFPQPNYMGLRPFAAPWVSGSAPRYAIEGGQIVLVPAPNASATLNTQGQPIPNLVIDICISTAYTGPYLWNGTQTQTPVLTATGQRIWFPDNFMNALVYGLAEKIAASDDTDRTKETRNACGEEKREQIRQLLFWAKSFRYFDRIVMQTNRSRYVGSRWRRSGISGGYP